ncbi:helix-turn-helix domain-containing protein [Microbacterium sp. Marseille-Q6965]|uniref:helix-turn-helix domain-containing protein n=1 Tax=Microbacterium sp. Marseille-Q6965 TaxID=2965072 RepID=UPI0021B72577|nr:helix-turn-helix domain-containing protein [Microbacterium sp. Marseille-Q6965]
MSTQPASGKKSKQKKAKGFKGFPEHIYPQYDEHDVAQILHVSVRTVQSWRSTPDKGPDFVKIGDSVRYHKQALIDYIEKRTVRRG